MKATARKWNARTCKTSSEGMQEANEEVSEWWSATLWARILGQGAVKMSCV